MRILINGGTRGIGRELVLKFADNKSNQVLVTGRNKQMLEELGSLSKNIIPYHFDITASENQYKLLVEYVLKTSGQLEILINCSGYLKSAGFIETDQEDARKMMETNFFGPARMIRNMKPLMSENSHIINITSMGGYQGSAKFHGMSYYSASKAALACLSECLALEFSGSKIFVNALALGAVQTEMLQEAFPGYVAPVTAKDMAEFISEFAINGHKYFNGKILPVALSTP